MTRRSFLQSIAAGATLTSAMPRARADTDSRPNIVLIMVDDMGYSDIGCFGGEINTPNIDRLAEGGLRCTHFYNAARCCPTRASILTGLYPHQAEVGHMVGDHGHQAYRGRLGESCVTIAEALKPAGYNVLMSGKWHVGERRPHWPTDRGFERYFGLISGGANYWDITKTKAEGVRRQMALGDEPWTPPDNGSFYMTDAITDHAVQWIREFQPRPEPFFLYTAYTAPHWPLHAWPEDIERYRGRYMDGWEALREKRHAWQLGMGICDARWELSPLDGMPWDEVEDKELMDLKMAVYAAQVDRMDQGVGRIVAELEERGELDNTLIMFLSDNGGCHEGGLLGFDNRKNGLPPGGVDSYMSYGRSWANASNTPFRRFKHWTHEGGIATPLVAHWPAAIGDRGGITSEVGHVVDTMATCLDAAGADYPTEHDGHQVIPLEGRSLLPTFRGEQRESHPALFWEHEGNRAARTGRWKLVSEHPDSWELYDMREDRTELNNLAAENPDVASDLIAQYDTWAERVGVVPWAELRKG